MIMLRLSSSPSVFFQKKVMQLGTVWMMLQSQNKIIFLVAVVLQPSIETIVLVSIWWLKIKMHCRPTDLHSYSKSSCGLGAFGLQSHVVKILCKRPFRTHVFSSLAQYPPTAPETR